MKINHKNYKTIYKPWKNIKKTKQSNMTALELITIKVLNSPNFKAVARTCSLMLSFIVEVILPPSVV